MTRNNTGDLVRIWTIGGMVRIWECWVSRVVTLGKWWSKLTICSSIRLYNSGNWSRVLWNEKINSRYRLNQLKAALKYKSKFSLQEDSNMPHYE